MPAGEAELLANVIELAELCGWLVYHTYDSRRSNPGFPDLTMMRCRPVKQLMFVELKSERGRLTEAQELWGEGLSAMAAVTSNIVAYRVWRPADWASGHIERVLMAGYPARAS